MSPALSHISAPLISLGFGGGMRLVVGGDTIVPLIVTVIVESALLFVKVPLFSPVMRPTKAIPLMLPVAEQPDIVASFDPAIPPILPQLSVSRPLTLLLD